jgi:peptidyl-prolyl cis-trans isomerase B (cyclophilin B)
VLAKSVVIWATDREAAFDSAECRPDQQSDPEVLTGSGRNGKVWGMTKVNLETNYGPVVLELDEAKAPGTVANFVSYVNAGHYNGTIFHRVIPGFMIQGGGFTPEMQQKGTQPPIQNEANNGLKNNKYTVAMARTNDPHSATAQFFVNVADNDFLNHSAPNPQGWGYTVFGKVVEGTEVVDKIAAVSTGSAGMHQDVPRDAVIIESASIA